MNQNFPLNSLIAFFDSYINQIKTPVSGGDPTGAFASARISLENKKARINRANNGIT